MITIVGLGVLGSRVCQHLPKDIDILLIDFDIVHEENIGLQYPQECIEMKKVEAARILWQPRAQALHKHIDVTTVGLLKDASLVIDCTDNMLTRYIINDFCFREGIPWVHAAMSDTLGTVATFIPDGPCFACVYPEGHGETCSRQFNKAVADHTASIAAHEALHLIKHPVSKFVRVLPTSMQVLEMSVRKNCPTHAGIYPYLQHKPQSFYITYCNNADCMAAKPLRHLHDRGAAKEFILHGKHVQLFPNGEIHFHNATSEDDLHAIAEEIYRNHFTR
jgi:molybdopterin/thiamine biosynthesis adenylyltransferase